MGSIPWLWVLIGAAFGYLFLPKIKAAVVK
jgi:hypothetical protein